MQRTQSEAKAPWQDCLLAENMLLGLVERQEGGAESADRLGLSLFRWDIKLSLSAHALLTFIGPAEEGKRRQAKREIECLFCT